MNKSEITVERVFPSGAWRCSAIINGQYAHRQYMGYTKREAIAEFYATNKKENKS